MHFLLLKSAHVAVAVCHGCLLVLLACSAWFKGLYINTCFLFLVGLFICFSYFFWTILVVLIFALFCCGRFSRLKFPVPHSFPPFSPASFLLLAWWHYPWVLCCLLCFFVFFYYFSPLFLRCFPSLRFWGLLQCPTILLVLLVFLVFPCAHASYVIYACMGGTWAPLTHTIFPYMICDSHMPTSTSLSINLPPLTLAKIMSCGTICASVWLVLRLLGANASPWTHPNPCPPSWVPLYPFMSAHIYVSFWGKFPGHTWPEIIPC